MTLHRTSRPNRRCLAAGTVAAGLALTGLAAITSSPAQAGLPPQCVTSDSVVTCTLSLNASSSGMALQIPSDVTSIQIHAVGERGGGAGGTGQSETRGGKPAVIDWSTAVSGGEVFTARLLEDGGEAGTSRDGTPDAGAGGSSVTVARGSAVIIQAAGGGGAGAFVPVLDGDSYLYSGGGNADSIGFRAAPNDPSGHPAGGGMPGGERSSEAGWGGPGARLYNCPNTLGFPNGSNGTSSSGGDGADGEYAGGGGGGGSQGGGGGGAGGIGCEGYSYGGGGGGGGSIVPGNATYAHSTTESYRVRITFAYPVYSSHSPSQMSFGHVPVGSTSAVQTLTVANTGAYPLQLGTGTLNGADPGSFLKAGDGCSSRSVAPGASCQVGLQFRPLTSGHLTATFTLTDNSVSSPHVVTLSGTGALPIAITSVSTLAFGAQEVGKPGPARTVSLTNTGTAPLVVSSTTLGGTNAPDFSTIANACAGATVAPGSSCSVSIRMTASAVGNRVGTFTFRHNASQPTSVVRLTGNGTPPADLKILGIGSVYTGRDHLLTRTVAGPGKLMIYPLVILNEDTVARSYEIALTSTGSASSAEVWTAGFGQQRLPQHHPGVFTTVVVQPKKTVSFNLRVTPTAAGQTISGVEVALLSDNGGLIEAVGTETNTAAPLNGTSSFELFSKQGSQLFVGGPVSGQTSTGQALTVGNAASFTLRLKNDGSSSQRIGLRLSDVDGCAGSFAVTVTAAGKVVTTPAFNGTYLTPLLAPTKFQDVLVTIKRVAGGCPSKTIRAQSLNSGVVVRTSYLLANAAYNASTD